jgi:hypothetical protein
MILFAHISPTPYSCQNIYEYQNINIQQSTFSEYHIENAIWWQ